MILFDRPGRRATSSSARRSRRSTTAACSARWRSGSRRSTAPTASPSSSRAPSTSRPPAGRGRSCSRCPRTCSAEAAASPTPRRYAPVAGQPGAARHRAAARAARRARERPLVIARRQRLDAARRARTCARFAEADRAAGRPARSAARTYFDNGHPQLRRRRRHRHQPDARRSASRDADLLLVDRRAPGRDDDRGLHAARCPAPAQTLVHVHRRRRGARPRLPAAICRSTRGMPRVRARRCARCSRLDARARWRGAAARGARRVPRGLAARRRDRPARSQMGDVHGCAARARCRADAIVTNGAGNFAIWVHRFYALPAATGTPARADHAARWATACRRRSPPRSCTPSAPWSASPATATS